ncbi:MAG: hypothetical protein H0U98_00175 [Alphaproteobacteria bacterium]|nr:hypothetical protein [Alphaproteobacteria bacterium]
MSQFPHSTVKIIDVKACGETKVCITMELVVDVHRLAEVSSTLLHVAAKGAANEKKK